MTLKFMKEGNQLFLKYNPKNGSIGWIKKNLDDYGECTVKRIFTFKKDDLIEIDEEYDYVVFKIAILKDSYYKFDKSVFTTENDLYISSNIKITKKMFIAQNDVSIIKKIDNVVNQDIRIGDGEKDIPETVFLNELVKFFPNQTELTKYVSSRISSIVDNYFEIKKDFNYDYEEYINRKIPDLLQSDMRKGFAKYEIYKYTKILQRLKAMIKEEAIYTERNWGEVISEIFLLIFPKYVKVLSEVNIYIEPTGKKKRRIDFMVVDSNGDIDIIEIKKPFEHNLLRTADYRNNYIPTRELSGSIMQIEKYLFYLNKFSTRNTSYINKKQRDRLPENVDVKITNLVAL